MNSEDKVLVVILLLVFGMFMIDNLKGCTLENTNKDSTHRTYKVQSVQPKHLGSFQRITNVMGLLRHPALSSLTVVCL